MIEANTTLTVGEKRLHEGREVEIADDGYFAIRKSDGSIMYAHYSTLHPVPEPTIEVPLSVVKQIVEMLQVLAGSTVQGDTLAVLMTQAGHQ